MDQSEVNKIIMDPDVPQGCRCNDIEKEFMILKGSIKKLIIDIREQMNASENPFGHIPAIIPPPAPAIREDPLDYELPPDREKQAEIDAAKALADKKAEERADKRAEERADKRAAEQAEKEKNMAQDKQTSTGRECPLTAKRDAVHDHCPLSSNSHAMDQRCPAAMASHAREHAYPAENTLRELIEQLVRELYSNGYTGKELRNGGNSPCGSYPSVYPDNGATCPSCRQPIRPAYNAYPYDRPVQNTHGHERSGYGQSGPGMYERADRQPPRAPHPFYYDHPEYEPAPYGNPSGSSRTDGYDYDPRYGPRREAPQRRMPQAPPEYYDPREDDGYYYGRESSEYRQPPVPDEYEQEYYRPAPKKRKVPRAPAAQQDYYYDEPAEAVEPEPARYRPAPRRRKGPYQPSPANEADDEYEMTEPLPEIDRLPDQPEPEQDLIRIRKRPRIPRVLPEPVDHDMILEQPNPKPRRSRSAKLRG